MDAEEELKNQITCIICYQIQHRPVQVNPRGCGHYFCSACLSRAPKSSGKAACPTCRQQIKDVKLADKSHNLLITALKRQCAGDLKSEEECAEADEEDPLYQFLQGKEGGTDHESPENIANTLMACFTGDEEHVTCGCLQVKVTNPAACKNIITLLPKYKGVLIADIIKGAGAGTAREQHQRPTKETSFALQDEVFLISARTSVLRERSFFKEDFIDKFPNDPALQFARFLGNLEGSSTFELVGPITPRELKCASLFPGPVPKHLHNCVIGNDTFRRGCRHLGAIDLRNLTGGISIAGLRMKCRAVRVICSDEKLNGLYRQVEPCGDYVHDHGTAAFTFADSQWCLTAQTDDESSAAVYSVSSSSQQQSVEDGPPVTSPATGASLPTEWKCSNNGPQVCVLSLNPPGCPSSPQDPPVSITYCPDPADVVKPGDTLLYVVEVCDRGRVDLPKNALQNLRTRQDFLQNGGKPPGSPLDATPAVPTREVLARAYCNRWFHSKRWKYQLEGGGWSRWLDSRRMRELLDSGEFDTNRRVKLIWYEQSYEVKDLFPAGAEFKQEVDPSHPFEECCWFLDPESLSNWLRTRVSEILCRFSPEDSVSQSGTVLNAGVPDDEVLDEVLEDIRITPLQLAIEEKDEDKACFLLQMSPPHALNHANKEGKTALHSAVETGSSLLVLMIIANGRFQNIGQSDQNGNTALHLAAGRSMAIYHMLLMSGRFEVFRDRENHDGLTAADLFNMGPFWVVLRDLV